MRPIFLKVILRATAITGALLLTTGIASAEDIYLQAQSFDKSLPGSVTVPMWGFASCTDATFTTCDAPAATEAPGPQIAASGGSLIDNGATTIDPNTGLEWLDLTATQGMSYAAAEASTYVTVDGYRHATTAEVEQFFLNAGFVMAGNGSANTPAATLLLDLMGCLANCGGPNAISRGFAYHTPTATYRSNYHMTGGGGYQILSLASDPASGFSYADTGNYLVRTASPAPPSSPGLTIHLKNTLSVPVSIVIPGQSEDGVRVPETELDGLGRSRARSFTHETGPGLTDTYTWSALRNGTYLYQSGTQPSIQVPMGLYGALVVGPATLSSGSCTSGQAAYDDPKSCHDTEAVMLFSEIDPVQNQRVADAASVAQATPACVPLAEWLDLMTIGYPCTIDYSPTYFLLNGEASPSAPLAAGDPNDRILLRLLNAGLRSHTPSIVGVEMGLIAEDGNPYPGLTRQQSVVLLAAGKTIDAIVTADTDVTLALFDRMPTFNNENVAEGGLIASVDVGTGSSPPTTPTNLAVNDVYPVTEDVPLVEALPGVLANDDPTLSNAMLVNGPVNGDLSLNANGSFTYTPYPNFSGVDTFTYSASVGVNSYPAQVTLNVSFANDEPVAGPDGPYVNNIGPDITVAAPGVLGNDGDPDGDALIAVIEGTPPPDLTFSTDGSFSYSGPGGESFSYHAEDTLGSVSNSVTVELNINPVANLTLNVQDPLAATVTDYRWLVQEDATFPNDPNALTPPIDTLALNFHKSYMPVVAQGCVGPGCLVAETPISDVALDPTKRYYVSVLPNDGGTETGHSLGGASIPVGPSYDPITVIVNNQPIPSSQISILAFEDISPTNGVPDADEPPLGGFQIVLEDAGGRYGQSGGTMSQDAFGNPLENSLDCFGGNPPPIGVILTCPDGTALIKNLPPGKFGVLVVAPSGMGTWTQTSTIEGTPINDAWALAGEPPYFVEFGIPSYHGFFGFVNPAHLVNPGGANTISGDITLLHDPRPPALPGTIDSGSYVGLSHTRPWIGVNTIGGDGPNIATVQADEDGHFEITGLPDGTHQLVVWDTYLDQVIEFRTVTLPAEAGDIGPIPVNAWFTRLEHNVFLDDGAGGGTAGDGVRNGDEAGLPEQAINIRWRDGTVFQSYPTDVDGFVPFDQVFPFFNWQIAEVDYTRFKPTGVTITVDGGGDVTSGPYPGLLNPQIQADGVSTTRTDHGPTVLLEAFQNFPGQTTLFDWGKAPYAPGENGGIAGIVYYGSTRGENDPRLTVGDPWEPGIPGVKVRLYREVETESGGTALALVEEVETDSWDAAPPEDCPGEVPYGSGDPFVDETLGAANVTRCYDGWRNWNQVRPGVFDGGYAFNGISPGRYVVEVVPPPGYELIKEEDKNVDFGDTFEMAPAALTLPGGAMPLVVPDQAMVLAATAAEPGLAQPPCVGEPHLVPYELSLFPGVATYAPFAGATRPLCDRKEVILSDQGQAAADFHLFTSTPVAAQFTGLITDDISIEANPASPGYGEKASPANLPFSIRDFEGHEVYRGYSDAFGHFNGVLPSTYSANVPIPSGYSPAMMSACLNDPGPISGPGGTTLDPLQNPGYGTFCYSLQFMPGTTTYLDTPILPTAAFASGYNAVDCAFADGSPVVAQVDTTLVAAGGSIAIQSRGQTVVANPAYEGPLAPAPFNEPTILRDYGFGATPGYVTLDGIQLANVWGDDTITATVPPTMPNGPHQLVIIDADGHRSFNAVTITVGTETPITVASGGSIQAAIDSASNGDLILVEPGVYNELVVMWKPVRLQGSGPDTIIDAIKLPVGKTQAWIDKVNDLFNMGTVDPLPGQPNTAELVGPGLLGTEIGAGITVLAKNDGSFASFPSRIDGFTITGADSGGGIFVNGYAHNLEVSNNLLTRNSGALSGGIRIGHPSLPTTGEGPFGYNANVHIHHNAITLNGALHFESAGGGVSLYTGSDDYEISHNFICGNYTQGDGAGIGHLGLSDNGLIKDNQIQFNQSFNSSFDQSGGGIVISGDPAEPGALTLGAGNVTIDANLIQGNQAGSGYGGGIRAQYVNGADATTPNAWSLSIINNMVVDNVAGGSGGGISLQDATHTSIINNTVANNDSTATLGSLIDALTVSEAQPSGIASGRHSPTLATALSEPNGFSNPELMNNIVWHNRAFHFEGNATPSLQPVLAPTTVGECASGALYWDLGVVGETLAGPALKLDPSYSVLTDLTDYNDGTNVTGDPDFMSEYCNGARRLSEPWGPMLAAGAFEEGGNFVEVRYGPLTQIWPAGGAAWDYHVGTATVGLSLGNAAVAPDHDYDLVGRPLGAGVTLGADEIFVPEPGFLIGLGAGVCMLGALGRRRRDRSRRFGEER